MKSSNNYWKYSSFYLIAMVYAYAIFTLFPVAIIEERKNTGKRQNEI
jgi:hypothetical protein